MRQSDRRFGLVDVLTTRTGGAIGVHPQIGRVDLDLDAVIDHRIDPDAGKAGLAAGGGVEGRDPDQAMHAGLGLQPAVGGMSGNLHGDRFDAGLFALAHFDDLRLVAAPFCPA